LGADHRHPDRVSVIDPAGTASDVRRWPGLLEHIAWWAVLVVVWLATLNAMSWQELVAASVLAAPGAVAARRARRAAEVTWRPRPRWLRALMFLPWAVVHDAVAVLLLAARPVRRPAGRLGWLSLARDADPARQVAREGLATAALSVSPGSVVVDSTDEHDRLLVHWLPVGETRLRQEIGSQMRGGVDR
jgi:multisubunit Na+/H+ antiporter MnhE subunit